MLKLEDIKVGAQINGLAPNELATIVAVTPVGADALSVVYKEHSGNIREQLLFRDSEERLTLAERGLAWSFEAPSRDFRLALEAMRIELRASALCPGLEAQFPARRREERGCRPVTGKDRASCQSGGAPGVRPGAVAQSPSQEAALA